MAKKPTKKTKKVTTESIDIGSTRDELEEDEAIAEETKVLATFEELLNDVIDELFDKKDNA